MQADPLQALRDIHLPGSVGWWPMALGWYLLLALAVLFVVLIGWWQQRRKQQSAGKRYAVRRLIALQHAYAERKISSVQVCRELSILLRRVALSRANRNDIANLNGESWIQFLSKTKPEWAEEPYRSFILFGPYTKQVGALPENYFTLVKQWIETYV